MTRPLIDEGQRGLRRREEPKPTLPFLFVE